MNFCWNLPQRVFFILSLLVVATIYHAEATAAQLTLTWTDNSTNESGFKIERKAEVSSIYAQVATVGLNVTSYTDSSLTTGTTYCYRVRAYNTASDSGYSNEACGTVRGPSLVSAIFPVSRSVQVGNIATAFALIFNYGTAAALGCGISLIPSLPATFSFQTTSCATNLPVGSPDTPVDIPVGGVGCFIFALTPTSPIVPTNVALNFDCTNSAPAPIIPGLNTFLFSASTTPTLDPIALALTDSNDGIVHLPGSNGANLILAGTANVALVGGTLTAEANTGNVTLPVTLSICQWNPSTVSCINPSTFGPSATMTIATGEFAWFLVFVQGSGNIPFDLGVNRIFISFHEGSITGPVRGLTSVAVRTR
jgi:hypothetical protein